MGCGASNNRNSYFQLFKQQKKIKDKSLFLEAFSSELKEMKGLVIDDETDFVQVKPISENNKHFKEELLVYGDESDTVLPWIAHIVQPNVQLEEIKSAPCIELRPAHIFGYRCNDSRGNLFFLDETNIIYHSGAFGIVQNIKTKAQKIFGGNVKSSSEIQPNNIMSSNNLNNYNVNNNNNNLSLGNMCHTNDICSITVFKGDVCMVATGQIDARPSVLIWSPCDPSVVYAKLFLEFGSKTVGNLAFDAEGKYVAALGRDEMNSFYVFDIQSKEILWKDITGSEIIFDVKFSPVNSNEFCLIGVNSVFFCNMASKEKMNHAKSLKKYKALTFTCVEYSKDGQKVITATANGLLVIWTANKENAILKDLIEIKVGNHSILNLKISEGSSKIYCTDSNKKVFVIDPEAESIEATYEMEAVVKGIDVNAKEKLLLGLADGRVIMKNLKSGRIREITHSHFSGKLKGLEFVPPNYILTSGQDNRIMLFNTNSHKLEGFSEINELAVKDKTKSAAANSPLNSAEYTANQSSQCLTYNKKYEHVAVGLDNGFISIRKSIKNLKLKFRDDLKISEHPICSVKFSPNDNLLAVISEDEKLTFLRVDNNYSIMHTYADLSGTPIEIDWDTTSNYVQVNNSNGEYFIYKYDSGKITDYTRKDLKNLNWATQNCKYGYLIQGVYRGITNDSFIRCVERSNNWNLLAAGNDDNMLEIFNFPCISDSCKPKSYFGHCDPIEKIKFNNDDTKVITVGGPDKSLVIWDIIYPKTQ